MKLRFRKLMAGLSLLLCIAVGVLWARSYRTADQLDVTWNLTRSPTYVCRSITLESDHGGFRFHWHVHRATEADVDWNPFPTCESIWGFDRQHSPAYEYPVMFPTEDPEPPRRTYGGFGLGWIDESMHQSWGEHFQFDVIVPDAALFVLAAAMTVWLGRKILRRPMRTGKCAECGYDLRATPERCPECGTVVARASRPC